MFQFDFKSNKGAGKPQGGLRNRDTKASVRRRRGSGSRRLEDGGGEGEEDEDDIFLRMTAPTNAIGAGPPLWRGANGQHQIGPLGRGRDSRLAEAGDVAMAEVQQSRFSSADNGSRGPPMSVRSAEPSGGESGDGEDLRGTEDERSDASTSDEDDCCLLHDYESFRLGDVIEETLRESRKLASTSTIQLWASFVRSSLAEWRAHIRRRNRYLQKLREAAQQREQLLKRQQQKQKEVARGGMIERIKMLKERALAEAERSEANVRLWKSSTLELDGRSITGEKHRKSNSGDAKMIRNDGEGMEVRTNAGFKVEGQNTNQKEVEATSAGTTGKPPRKGSAGMLQLPKIKLSFNWDKASPKESEKRERENVTTGGEGSPVPSFVNIEEAEEASLNKSAKKKKPLSPRLSQALSLLGRGYQQSRSRGSLQDRAVVTPLSSGGASPPLSPRRIEATQPSRSDPQLTGNNQPKGGCTTVVEADKRKFHNEQPDQQETQQRIGQSPRESKAKNETKLRDEATRQTSGRRRERSKTLGYLLPARRNEQKEEEKKKETTERSTKAPPLEGGGSTARKATSFDTRSLSHSAGSVSTSVSAKRQPPPLKRLPTYSSTPAGKTSGARRPSPRPGTPSGSTATANPPQPQDTSMRTKRSSTCSSSASQSSTSGLRLFQRNSSTQARTRSPSPPQLTAEGPERRASGQRAPSPTTLGSRNRASSPVIVPIRQRSASTSATPTGKLVAPSPVKPTPIRTTFGGSRTSLTQQQTSSTGPPGGRRAAGLAGRSSSMPSRARSPSPPPSSSSSISSSASPLAKATPRPGSGQNSIPPVEPSSTSTAPSSDSPPSLTASSPLSSSPSKPSRFLAVLTKSSSSLTVKKAFSLTRSPSSADKQAETVAPDFRRSRSEGTGERTLVRSKSHRDARTKHYGGAT